MKDEPAPGVPPSASVGVARASSPLPAGPFPPGLQVFEGPRGSVRLVFRSATRVRDLAVACGVALMGAWLTVAFGLLARSAFHHGERGMAALVALVTASTAGLLVMALADLGAVVLSRGLVVLDLESAGVTPRGAASARLHGKPRTTRRDLAHVVVVPRANGMELMVGKPLRVLATCDNEAVARAVGDVLRAHALPGE